MRSWSFPLGRWFGVDIRIHAFFLALTGPCMLAATSLNLDIWRGVVLWLLLLAVVAVREVPRLIASAYYGLQIRNILLLPTGGLYAFANPESIERAASSKIQTPMAMIGPVSNIFFGLIVAGLIAGTSPQVSLIEFPLITAAHLMRSTVWLSVFLGLINIVPAYPLDGGRILLGEFKRSKESAQASRAAAGISQVLAVLVFGAGIALHVPWLVMAGFFVFIGAQLEDQGTLFQSVVDNVRMKDVMLTDFSTMSPSDTLEDALFKTIHSLQDDFPVVRGVNLVGIVSRQSILDALRADGNGYIQGVMSRAFQVAQPDDSLGAMIRRMTAGRGLSLMPVTEGEKIVGIVTLQNLMHSMGLLAEHRKLQKGGRNRQMEAETSHDRPLAPGLYLVATPIGNLEDITLRALRVLKSADRIACEDTRQTQKLLNHFGIETPATSLHEHNETEKAPELVEELKQGARIAVVSDAGMPGISDPGMTLARAAIEAGVAVYPIPGANAAVSALVASGLSTESFHYAGFLPAKSGARRAELERLAALVAEDQALTLIFYEAPHRILETLEDVEKVWGTDCRVVVARELTKLHEEFLRGGVGEVRSDLASRDRVRGEITFLIEARSLAKVVPLESLKDRVAELQRTEGLDEMSALKRAARERGISKSEAYRELQRARARR